MARHRNDTPPAFLMEKVQIVAHKARRNVMSTPDGYLVPAHQAKTSPETTRREREIDPHFVAFDTTPTDSIELLRAIERADRTQEHL